MQIATWNPTRAAAWVSGTVLLMAVASAWAYEMPETRPHHTAVASRDLPCTGTDSTATALEGFTGVQIETSELGLYERFFETVLQVPVVQRSDHPQADRLRGYCYRGVLVVVRQDLRTPRPTGWVQINFTVPDVAAVHDEIEQAYRSSPVSRLDETERATIIRIRLKLDVMRGDRHATRLEVFGPEGFMIGFDQFR